MKYENAMRQLEEIVDKLEKNELDIDDLTVQLKRAQTLIRMCKDKLTKADEEINALLQKDSDALAASSKVE